MSTGASMSGVAADPEPAASTSALTDETAVLRSVNRTRTDQGLAPFTIDQSLKQAAQDFAADMRQRGYFGHRSPEGELLPDRLRRARVQYSSAAENIAQGQTEADEVMTAWMNSPGHRTNILNPNFRRIGIGRSGNYWVQEFAD